jgi:two-component system phosphate regulon sensor histidine kinase PhoR
MTTKSKQHVMIDVPDGESTTIPMRFQAALTYVRRNVAKRWNVMFVATLLALAFVPWGGLPLSTAISGAAAVAAWAALWPDSRSSSTLADLEARRNSKDAARAAGARVWTGIIDALPDPTLVLNGTGTVLAISPAAAEIFSGNGIGRHLSLITRAPELLAAVEDALALKRVQVCRLDFKVPVERSLVGSVAPLNVADSELEDPQLLVVLRDLTEQDRLVRMRADFVANASHELRTPLASLKGFVETLQDAAKDDPVARERFLAIMQQQAERMARLIDDLLSLSRIEMKAHVMPRERIDAGGIIAHVAQTLIPIAEEKSITLEIGTLPHAVVLGERDELIQVFQNLIENAIKYGRKGGHVTVSGSVVPGAPPRGDKLSIEVSDDGPGIAPEHLPRLTERFYRVNAAQSRHAGGTGLGLAIVKHVLNRHQADLQVESVIGSGSTFRVVIPVQSL